MKPLLKTLTWAASLYGLFLFLLVVFERYLVFPAPDFDAQHWQRAREGIGATEFTIPIGDGEEISAWMYEPSHGASVQHRVIFFHGNAETLPYRTGFLRRLANDYDMQILAVEYPGYGPQGGSPSEAKIHRGALASLRWYCGHQDFQSKELIAMGVSLGGGAAMGLTQHANLRGLVLISTFAALPDAAAATFPLFPVRLLMRNRFNSLERMRTCSAPLLQFHGAKDTLVPIDSALRLFEASPSSNKRFVTFPKLGHNDALPAAFWTEVPAFLVRLDPPPLEKN